MKKSRTVETITRTTVELDGAGIEDLIRSVLDVPITAEGLSITIRVPGGGDYSGMDLDLGGDVPVRVAWMVRETS